MPMSANERIFALSDFYSKWLCIFAKWTAKRVTIIIHKSIFELPAYHDNSQGDVGGRTGQVDHQSTIANASVLANWEMPLEKQTLLWKDNQFGCKHLFKFDRITASELETGLSIMLASSDRWWVAVESGPKCTSAYRYRNLPFLFMASTEQHLSDDLWHQNWEVNPSRIGLIEVRCSICKFFALFNQTQGTKKRKKGNG